MRFEDSDCLKFWWRVSNFLERKVGCSSKAEKLKERKNTEVSGWIIRLLEWWRQLVMVLFYCSEFKRSMWVFCCLTCLLKFFLVANSLAFILLHWGWQGCHAILCFIWKIRHPVLTCFCRLLEAIRRNSRKCSAGILRLRTSLSAISQESQLICLKLITE